jgi:3-deoxy-manno-octulosonate cytidylyltransferase (CMP-KDO synthetase)
MHSLVKFVKLKAGRLEVTEKLEQLRLLENHLPLHVVVTRHRSRGVDRPEDLEAVIQILQNEKD